MDLSSSQQQQQEEQASIALAVSLKQTQRTATAQQKPPRQQNQSQGRKPIFFHHISKAGGSFVNALAMKNGEVHESLRWKESTCRYLTECADNVTFVQFEGPLDGLTAKEYHILFVEKKYITFTQLRNPRALEESWFHEILHGYQHECAQNKTFAEYTLRQLCSSLQRTNSLLQFLGSNSIYGAMANATIPIAQHKALSNLELFDFVTVLEDQPHPMDLFCIVFGWTKLQASHFSWSSSNKTQSKTPLSKQEEALLRERLKPDRAVYKKAKTIAEKSWSDWMAYNKSKTKQEPFEIHANSSRTVQ